MPVTVRECAYVLLSLLVPVLGWFVYAKHRRCCSVGPAGRHYGNRKFELLSCTMLLWHMAKTPSRQLCFYLTFFCRGPCLHTTKSPFADACSNCVFCCVHFSLCRVHFSISISHSEEEARRNSKNEAGWFDDELKEENY